jgi:hypothetical protein
MFFFIKLFLLGPVDMPRNNLNFVRLFAEIFNYFGASPASTTPVKHALPVSLTPVSYSSPVSTTPAEVGKVTLKSNGDEALNDEFLLKCNGDEALNDVFL